MERERPEFIKREEILSRSPILSHFLHEQYSFDIRKWHPQHIERITVVYTEIEKHLGTGWDKPVLSAISNQLKDLNYANFSISQPEMNIGISSIMLAGYEIGNEKDIDEIKDAVFAKCEELNLFNGQDLPHVHYEVGRAIFTSVLKSGVELRYLTQQEKIESKNLMAEQDSDFGAFTDFIKDDLDLDDI